MGLMRLFFLMGILFAMPAAGQNLLMNEGFEDENICTEYIKNCAPEGCISTSLTADYYFDDVKHAFEGRHFIGMVFSDGNKRGRNSYKFIRSRLLCALREGAEYRLELYVRSHHPHLDSVGIYFSADDILYRKHSIVAETPQLWIRDGMDTAYSPSWRKVSLVYTAGGHENFISIGDFRKTGQNFSGRPDLNNMFYYFIDAVRLEPSDPAEQLCDDRELLKEEAYGFNPRHSLLDKLVYAHRKNPPPLTPASKTVRQRIDTLIIPDVLFATNSFALSQKAHLLLDSFISQSRLLRVDSLVIEGHTDSTGTVLFNQKLSRDRAASVASYLQPYFPAFIFTRGWASEKPVSDNRTAAGRQKNRRVEIYLYLRE